MSANKAVTERPFRSPEITVLESRITPTQTYRMVPVGYDLSQISDEIIIESGTGRAHPSDRNALIDKAARSMRLCNHSYGVVILLNDNCGTVPNFSRMPPRLLANSASVMWTSVIILIILPLIPAS